MISLRRRAVHTIQSVAHTNPLLGRFLRYQLHRPRKQAGRSFVQYHGRRFVVVSSRTNPDSRKVGIYLRGGCDLPAMFGIAPLMRGDIRGTCAIVRDPIQIAGSRSDMLLQAAKGLDGVPEQEIREVSRRLHLPPAYFHSDFIQPTFTIPHGDRFGEFAKTVVVLSTGPDLTRTVYGHRRHGFLVDPGGWWLNQDIGRVLADLSTTQWFSQNFQSVGRMPLEQFRHDFAQLVRLLQERTGAQILVFSTLTVEPGHHTHNYQLAKKPEVRRRRQLMLDLFDLSARMGFHIVDIDRVFKENGVRGEVDFAHFSNEQLASIAREGHRILREIEII